MMDASHERRRVLEARTTQQIRSGRVRNGSVTVVKESVSNERIDFQDKVANEAKTASLSEKKLGHRG